MARYLIVKIEDTNPSNFARVRRGLHKISQEHNIQLSDVGMNFDLVTDEQRKTVEDIFEAIVKRAKEVQKMIDGNSAHRNKRG